MVYLEKLDGLLVALRLEGKLELMEERSVARVEFSDRDGVGEREIFSESAFQANQMLCTEIQNTLHHEHAFAETDRFAKRLAVFREALSKVTRAFRTDLIPGRPKPAVIVRDWMNSQDTGLLALEHLPNQNSCPQRPSQIREILDPSGVADFVGVEEAGEESTIRAELDLRPVLPDWLRIQTKLRSNRALSLNEPTRSHKDKTTEPS